MPFNHKVKQAGPGGGGWYRSTRFGATPDKVYTVGDRNNLYISEDGGASWLEGAGQLNGRSEDMCVSYINPERILVATDGGVFMSTDGGYNLKYMFDQVQNHDGSYGIKRGKLSAYGNSCTAVEFNRHNSTKMYAGSGGAGTINGSPVTTLWLSKLDDWKVFYSDDNGQTWDIILSGPIIGDNRPQCVFKIRNSYHDENIIYVSTSDFTYKGVHNGSTWSWTSLPQSNRPGTGAYETLDDVDNPNILYTIWPGWVGDSGPWGYPAKNFYKSADGGQTWVQKGNGMDSTYACGQEIRFDKSGNGTLWFGNRYPQRSKANQLYKSLDKGENWIPIGTTSFPENNWYDSAFVATSFDVFGDHIHISPAAIISKDGGNTWDSTCSIKKIVDNEVFYEGRGSEFINTYNLDYKKSTRGKNVFFAAADHKIMESRDYGISWRFNFLEKVYFPTGDILADCSIITGTKTFTSNIRLDLSDSKLTRITNSNNGADGCYKINSISGTEAPYTYTVSEKYIYDNGRVNSTSFSNFSSNGTGNVEAIAPANTGMHVCVSTYNENDIFLTIVYSQKPHRGILCKSSDGGITWVPKLNAGLPVEDRVLRTMNHVVVTSNGTLFGIIHYDGIWKSTNAGEYWQKIPIENGPRGSRGCLAVSKDDTLYAGVRYPGDSTANGGIWRSINGGVSWQQFGVGTFTSVTSIYVDPTNDNIIWATQERSNGGVYKSTDKGQTWELKLKPDKCPLGYDIAPGYNMFIGVTVDPKNPNHIYAGTQDNESYQFFYGQGVYKSIDGGETWDYIPLPGNHSALAFGANWGEDARIIYPSVDQKSMYAIYADDQTETNNTYYVATDGSGDFNSIADVNSNMGSFQPGDHILFKRGNIFNDQTLHVQNTNGSSGNEVVFGAYGSGNLPILGNNNSTTLIIGARIQNASYIIFENLEIRSPNNRDGATGLLIQATNIEIRNCTIKGSNASVNKNVSGLSIGEGSQYIHIHNNDIYHFGNGIVGYACPNTTIEYNKVHDIQRYDGNFGGWGIRLTSNTFEDPDEPNWWFDFNYTGIIRGNEIYDFSRYAIDCATGTRVIIEENDIHHNTSDPSKDQEYGSGIKAGEKNKNRLHEGTIGTIVRRNKIHDLRGGGTGEGTPNIGITTVNSCDGDIYYNLIYNIDGRGISRTGLSEDSQQVNQSWTVYNNTVISGKECMYTEYQTNSKSLIKNNIFEVEDSSLPALYCKTYRSQVIVENNLFTNRGGSSDSSLSGKALYFPGNNAVYNSNLENTNPLFVNRSSNDYNIQETSPAINSGQGLPNDKQGNSIVLDINKNNIVGNYDIGAYEYTEEVVPPIEPPDITISSPSNQSGIEGSSNINFTCTFTLSDGSTNKGYQWWRTRSGNVTELTNDGHYSGTQNSTLTINNIQLSENQDSFVCECKNLDGYPEEGYWKNSNSAVLTVTSTTEDYLTVSPSSVTLSNQANVSSTANVSSNVSWEIINIPSWLDVSPITGNGSTTITLKTLTANTNTQQRSINLTIRQV